MYGYVYVFVFVPVFLCYTNLRACVCVCVRARARVCGRTREMAAKGDNIKIFVKSTVDVALGHFQTDFY
jgi:hypothetical protein